MWDCKYLSKAASLSIVEGGTRDKFAPDKRLLHRARLVQRGEGWRLKAHMMRALICCWSQGYVFFFLPWFVGDL